MKYAGAMLLRLCTMVGWDGAPISSELALTDIQCLIEYAIVPWDMDANSLIEHALCMVRQSEQSDLMDILAERIVSLEQYQAKQNPLTRRLLAQIGYHVGTHSLKPEIQDRRWKIAVGLGKLLRVLNETEQVDPTDIAARAAEDGNHHSLAAVLRLIRDASEHIIKQIKKTWGL